MTVHITVINIKGIEKASPDTLAGFCKGYFAFLQVKWKFPNAGFCPMIFPHALAHHLGSVWSTGVHSNWWFFWAHADGQCRQGALLGMAATLSLAPRLLAAQDTCACCTLCLYPSQPDTHQPARHAPDKLNAEEMVSPKSVSSHLGGKILGIGIREHSGRASLLVSMWPSEPASKLSAAQHQVFWHLKNIWQSPPGHMQWHIPDGTDTSVPLSTSLPWVLRDVFILWKIHWGVTEQRCPWDNLSITLLWQLSEQKRPAVRCLHRPPLQLREEKRARKHHLSFVISHPPSSLWNFLLMRIPDCCSFVLFSWALGTQHGLFCNFSLPNLKQDFFLWFYLLIAPHTEDEKCCGYEVGKDSFLEDILWNEKASLVTQEWLTWPQQEENTTVLGFPRKLLLPQQPGLLEKEVVSVSQEERVLKFVIEVRIIIEDRSS